MSPLSKLEHLYSCSLTEPLTIRHLCDLYGSKGCEDAVAKLKTPAEDPRRSDMWVLLKSVIATHILHVWRNKTVPGAIPQTTTAVVPRSDHHMGNQWDLA